MARTVHGIANMTQSFLTLSPTSQTERYAKFYDGWGSLRSLVRFDIRYRCRRLRDFLREAGLDECRLSTLEMGFGGGDLLRSLPKSWAITGAEISASAVEQVRADERFAHFRSAEFVPMIEDDPESLPRGPFDVVVSSHVLEHVASDDETLRAVGRRLVPGGLLLLFVPIEEPDYIRFHRRNYSLQSIAEVVSRAGFSVERVEGSMQINGHLWKLVTIPSRRGWPVVGPVVDALRCVSLSLFPHRAVLFLDRILDALGFGARQAFVVARKC